MPQLIRCTLMASATALLAACDSTNPTRDLGIDSKGLSELQAGIWVDPNGCHHWIIDDGIEGYMSQRLDRFGRPVCLDSSPGTFVSGEFKSGSPISDELF